MEHPDNMHVSVQSPTPPLFRTGPSNPLLDKTKYFGPRTGGGKLSKSHASMFSNPSNAHRRAGSGNGMSASSSAPHLNSWDFESQTSDRSSVPIPASQKLLPKSDVSQESVRSLADFLRTREPPRDNFMSIPESDDSSSGAFRNSPFSIFGRRKFHKRKHSKRGLLQLPDSAVAAKTRNGAIHIAISIPAVRDHWAGSKTRAPHSPAVAANSQVAVSAPKLLHEAKLSGSTTVEQGAQNREPSQYSTHYPIVIPGPESGRPLWSLYESPNESQLNGQASNSKSLFKLGETPRGQRRYVAVSPTGLLRGDGFRKLVQQGGSLQNTKGSAHGNSTAAGRPNVIVSPATHPEFGLLPPRLSSIPPAVPWFPEAFNFQIQRDGALDILMQPAPAPPPPPSTSLPSPPQSTSKNSSSNSIIGRSTAHTNTPTIFGTGTALTAQTYSNAHVELHTITRPHTPRLSSGSSHLAGPGEPPNRKLPDLPTRRSQSSRRKGSSAGASMKSYKTYRTAASSTTTMEKEDIKEEVVKVVQHDTIQDHEDKKLEIQQPEELDTRKDSCITVAPLTPTPSPERALSRQERVRERKMRDLRNSLTLSSAPPSLVPEALLNIAKDEAASATATHAESEGHSAPTTPKVHAIDRANSIVSKLAHTQDSSALGSSSLRRRRQNAPSPLDLSPVMVVAWLPPYEVPLPDDPLPSPSIPPKNPRRNTKPNIHLHTPPDSGVPAQNSSSTSGSGSGSDTGDQYDGNSRTKNEENILHDIVRIAKDSKPRWRGSWAQDWSTSPRPLRYPSRGRSGFCTTRHQSPATKYQPPSPSPSSVSWSASPHSSSCALHHDSTQDETDYVREETQQVEGDRERTLSESRRKLECRRRERRMRRNISIQLKELEDRVRRVERENMDCKVVSEVVSEVVRGVVRGLEGRI